MWTAMGMAYNKECSSVSGQKREIENRDGLFRKIESLILEQQRGIIDE